MSSIFDDAAEFFAGKTWKTGQRVPISGTYRDQHGVSSFHEAHRTFPPCIGRKGECAHRTLIRPA